MHRSFGVFLSGAVLFFASGALSPAGAAEPQEKAEPTAPVKAELLVDEGKSLFVLADRQEKIRDFFVGNRVVVGIISQKDLDRLTEAKAPIEKLFLNYTSANDDPEKSARYGDNLTIAPLRADVKALIEKETPKGDKDLQEATVILQADAHTANLYHIVGVTTHSSVSFFDGKEKLASDDFAPCDLRFKK